MPRFCSDQCRRAPLTAERALANARYHKAAAERTIAYYEEHLARYARLSGTCVAGDVGDREPGPDDVPFLEVTGSRVAIAAETR